MERRKFIQTLCFASAGLIVGCKSTPKFSLATRKNNALYIPHSEFSTTSIIQVAFDKRAIGVTKIDDETFNAVLLDCTHMGCAVDINNTESGFICPCHGAKFSSSGDVLKGPAKENLKQFLVSTTQEHVIIHLL